MKKSGDTIAAPIVELGERLVTVLERASIPSGLKDEKELERHFVLREVEKILQGSGEKFDVCAHPWNSEDCCPKHKGVRQSLGCPECWRGSKPWASVHMWGMQHNFDLAIRDQKVIEDSLVVETKLVSFESGQPNGDVQRLFGQCSLAKTKHKIVIGFCAYRGTLREKFPQDKQDTSAAMRWFKEIGVKVVFRKIE